MNRKFKICVIKFIMPMKTAIKRKHAFLISLLAWFGSLPVLFAQTTTVGAIDGVFNVSDMGVANYTIPVKVPPGIGGVQPSLSINYSSQGGNSLLGMGWSLAASSAITRTGRNIYDDNITRGIALSSNDRFSLDGMRLVLTGGTYGGADSRYATEVESYRTIKANGNAGAGPLSFSVTDQNGWTYTYGGTEDSRLTYNGSVISWFLSKVTDLNGNEMIYQYENLGDEPPTLSRIKYNRNGSQGLDFQTNIAFLYIYKPDANFAYVAGRRISQDRRLHGIIIEQFANNQFNLVQKYIFEYQDDFYSHLVKITQTGADEETALPPTNITYGATNNIIIQDQQQLLEGIDLEYIPGDYNADGLTDIVTISKYYNPFYNKWKLFKNVGNSFVFVQEGNLPDIPQEYVQNLVVNPPVSRNYSPTFFDFNGDGKNDFVYKASVPLEDPNEDPGGTFNANYYNILLSNGIGLTPLQRKIVPGLPPPQNNSFTAYQFFNSYPLVGDFDGDGKQEILVLKESEEYSSSSIYTANYIIGDEYLTEYGTDFLLATALPNMPFDATYINAASISGRSKLFVIDYDGDGKNEILCVWTTHAQVYKLNVTFDANHKPVIGSPAFVMVNQTGYPTVWHDILTGDFNGDQITDVLTFSGSSGWEIGYGKGNGLMNDIQTAPALLGNKPSNYNGFITRPVVIADYNGDGKDDIFDYTSDISNMYGSPYAPRLHYSLGNNQFITANPSIDVNKLSPDLSHYILSDCNGDGVIDFLTRNNIFQSPTTVCFHPNENRHQVSKITNGLGVFTKITYASLTNGTVYQPGNQTSSYPVVRKTLPLKVVSSIQEDNGINTTGNTTTFQYEGMKYAYWGRGLLGFDKVTQKNLATQASAEKYYGLNTDYYIPLLNQVRTLVNGNIVTSQNNRYGIKDFGNKRIFPYIDQQDAFDNITRVNARTIYDYAPSTQPGVADGFMIGKPYSITTLKGYKVSIDFGDPPVYIVNQLEKTVQHFSYPNFLMIPIGGSPLPYHRRFQPGQISTTQIRNGDGEYTRTASFRYDDNHGWLIKSVQDPGTAHEVQTTYTYNGFGNLVKQRINATGLPASAEIYQYDPTQRFVTHRFNEAYPNLQYFSSYHPVTGNLSSTINPEYMATLYTYDPLSRLIHTSTSWEPDEGAEYLLLDAGAPASAQYMIRGYNDITEWFRYYDRLGRLVRSRAIGYNGPDLLQDFFYNTIGQQFKETLPYYEGEPQFQTYYYHDSYGRLTLREDPNGTTTYSYASSSGGVGTQNYDTYTITVTDPSGYTKKTITDAAGRMIRSQDPGGELRYTYHSSGGVKQTSLNGSPVVTNTYDAFGRLKTVTDANYDGSYVYAYNAYDQVTKRKNPKGVTSYFFYDLLGNLTKKTTSEGDYIYTYNFQPGQNALKLTQISGPQEGVSIRYDYGYGSRLNYEERTIGDEVFHTSYTYDSYGRMRTRTFPNGVAVRYYYKFHEGSLQAIGRPDDSCICGSLPGVYTPAYIYSATEKNAFGQITQFGHGSQFYSGTVQPGQPLNTRFWSNNDYSPIGLLTSQHTVKPATNMSPGILLRHYQYSVIPSGLLVRRKDVKYNLQEDFSYDNALRLKQAQGQNLNPPPVLQPPFLIMNYSANGNMEDKSDAGTFAYDQANRVTEINPYVNIPGATQSVSYTPFDKVSTISENGYIAKFNYWPDEERAVMRIGNEDAERTVYYAPDYDRIVTEEGVRELCYVRGPEGNIVAIIENQDGTEHTYYVLTDHLGSITQVFDDAGNMLEEKSFDAWGRPRRPNTWGPLAPVGVSLGWDRGYTGHEHIPEFGIINMNGRLYDPLMGRMFSPDPYIMGADNTQGYNRYTYALNNPLSYTDPSGNIAWFVPVIIGAVVGAYMGGSTANGTYNPGQWDYNSGRTWGYMAGGAIVGGISGGIGGAIASSGIPMANTFGIAGASFVNSLGTAIYTGGMTDVSVSFGVGSYNFTKGSFRGLWDWGNLSTSEKIGYSLGALANLQDIVAGFHGITGSYKAEYGDVDHARFGGQYNDGKNTHNIDISVAHDPAPDGAYKYTGNNNLVSNLDYARYWATKTVEGKYYDILGKKFLPPLELNNVNGKWLSTITGRIKAGNGLWGIGKLKYGTSMFGCQSHVAHALWGVGVPTLPINFHPFVLYGQLWLRQAGIYASPMLINH